jgi:hypothetical protein
MSDNHDSAGLDSASLDSASLDATAAAAKRHAANKRVIKPFVEHLLAASGPVNAAWLSWYRALRICVDGKKDDLADALCLLYYHLREVLWEAARKRSAALKKVNAKRKSSAAEVDVPPVLEELTASCCDLGFKNLAYAVVRVFVDVDKAHDPLLQGVNFVVLRWERVDCLAIAGVSGININATNMHRLTEILMCGVAKHADSLFGTLPSDLALPRGHLDYFLLENQKGGGMFGGGSNIKTYTASHILQACCMLHYAIKGLPTCPTIEFVSSAKKMQDASLMDLLPGASTEPQRKRARKGEADQIKPVHVIDLESGASAVTAVESPCVPLTAAMTAGVATGVATGVVAGAGAKATDEVWRAPFSVGVNGLKWKKGQNPDPKKREAEAKRTLKKKTRAQTTTLDDEF